MLAEIKTDPRLCAIPVVVLTTSADPGDFTASYTAHANAYITKPRDLTDLSRIVLGIYRFFGETARVPGPAPAAEHDGDGGVSPPDDPDKVPGPRPVRLLLWQPFTAATVAPLRHALTARLAAAGLTGDAAFDFVAAVHELVTNAVRHGGGHGRLELSLQERTLICSISDHGRGASGLPAGPPPNDRPGGRGLYLARQLTGALLIDQRGDGVTATVTVELPAAG
ncbi:MAG TPA: ATP-binding protein [Micromonospora sp.]|nr:ATP-binding protein [Micromonospora sp.]